MALDLSLVGKTSSVAKYVYTWKDVVLYALGVGAKRSELDYLYEGRGPRVLPSFAVVPAFQPMLDLVATSGGNLAMIVHSAQRVEVKRAFPPEGTLATTATVRAIYDMRRFAQVVVDTATEDAEGQLLATTSSTIMFRGEGGWGGDPPPKVPPPVPPPPKDRPSDFRVEEVTSPEQALLYRLSGDLNPLHADPAFAASVGFERGPILHGLCTYGFMVRHVAQGAAEGDAGRVVAFDAQFRRPVWPGDTLVTEGWKMDGGIALSVKVKERDEAVVTGAWARVA